MKELTISVKRSIHRKDDLSSSLTDPVLLEKIKNRDGYTCQYCDHRALKYHDVHHVNDDHHDNREENLITACCLCHATLHIGFSGEKQRGVIIYLDPDKYQTTQAAINQIARHLWLARAKGPKNLKKNANRIIDHFLKARHQAVIHLGTCDPSELGSILCEMDDDAYAKRADFLKGIYFLPNIEKFPKPSAYWLKHAVSKFPPNEWAKTTKQKLQKWTETQSDIDIALLLGIISY